MIQNHTGEHPKTEAMNRHRTFQEPSIYAPKFVPMDSSVYIPEYFGQAKRKKSGAMIAVISMILAVCAALLQMFQI